MTDNLAQARRAVQAAEEQLRIAQRELVRVASAYPEEPYEDVVTFGIRYDGNGKTYRYAAIRVGALWYTTGTGRTKQAHGVTWNGLIDFIRRHHVGMSVNVNTLSPRGGSKSIVVDTSR